MGSRYGGERVHGRGRTDGAFACRPTCEVGLETTFQLVQRSHGYWWRTGGGTDATTGMNSVNRAEFGSSPTPRSLAEPAGWVGLGQFAMRVVRGEFAGFVGLESVCSPEGQLRLRLRPLTALGECISPVLTQHARHPHRRCQRSA